MLTAAQRALDLPELVALIIVQRALTAQQEGQSVRWQYRKGRSNSRGLRQRRNAIFQCLLVNRTWNVEGTKMLWEVYPLRVFKRLPRSRRQDIADMIRVIRVGGEYPAMSYSVLSGIEQFPCLATLDFGAGFDGDCFQSLYPVLFQARLEHLRFRGALTNSSPDRIINELFPLIQNHCPNLYSFEMNCHSAKGRPPSYNEILEFLVKMPSLHTIVLGRMSYVESCGSQLFKHLAERPRLESLTLLFVDGELSSEVLAFLSQSTSPLFTDLRIFRISGGTVWNSCRALFRHFTSLCALEVTCRLLAGPGDFNVTWEHDAYHQIFSQLPNTPGLEHLKLELETPRRYYGIDPCYLKLPGEALIRLADKYRNLRVLKLSVPATGIDGREISHVDIGIMGLLLPNLTTLRIGLRFSHQHFTMSCLGLLVKHCENLEEFEIPGYVDITRLEMGRNCLFPRLHYIATRLDDGRKWEDWEIRQLIAVLEYHSPRLRSLAGYYGRDWPQPMVSVHPPWTASKIRRFVSRQDEDEDNESDWSNTSN